MLLMLSEGMMYVSQGEGSTLFQIFLSVLSVLLVLIIFRDRHDCF